MTAADPLDGDAARDGTTIDDDHLECADYDPAADPDLHVMTERACEHCGDLVLILSSRDWCDACELEDPD